ncbi:hypothetical protein [Leucothrix arctica]|uniref:Uncharacterized protein n=1 Tax=Leucothrix arctica TaxID=1481894 RepID=A0A317CHR2_9GAMM|nr:hypothetical protein [Leucothrix arctica]PWQ97909.1 hypothetical protein DKT75_05445 [Leucothrix arctica]
MKEYFTFVVVLIILVPLVVLIYPYFARLKFRRAFNKQHGAETREMGQEDLAVMQHFYNFGLAASPKTKARWGAIYTIHADYIAIKRHKPLGGFPRLTFDIHLGSKLFVVTIPPELEGEFVDGQELGGKRVELRFDGQLVLHEMHEVTGLKHLYQQRLEENFNRRPATKAEKNAFLLSPWITLPTWLFVLVISSKFISDTILAEIEGVLLIYSIPLVPLCFLMWLAYKRRVKYIQSRDIVQLSGNLRFDEERYDYGLFEQTIEMSPEWLKELDIKEKHFGTVKHSLELPPKWLKCLKKQGKEFGEVKMEAMLHSYDYLESDYTISKYQPISIKGEALDINLDSVPVAKGIWLPLITAILLTINITTTPITVAFLEVFNSYSAMSGSTELASDKDLYDPNKVANYQAVATHGLAIPSMKRTSDCSFLIGKCPERTELFFIRNKEAALQQYPDFAQAKEALVIARKIEKSYELLGSVAIINKPISKLSEDKTSYLLSVLASPAVEKFPSIAVVQQLIETKNTRGKTLASALAKLLAESLEVTQQLIEKDLEIVYRLNNQQGTVVTGYNLSFFKEWQTKYRGHWGELRTTSPENYEQFIGYLSAYPVTAPIDGILYRYENDSKMVVHNEHHSIASASTAAFIVFIWGVYLLFLPYLLWLVCSRLFK